MTTLAELSNRLNTIQIDNTDSAERNRSTQMHYLSIKWPAGNIIAPGKKHIHIPRPANIEMRSRPDEQSTHSIHIPDLHVAQLHVQQSQGLFSTTPLLYGEARRLVNAVHELQKARGQSWLHALSYDWIEPGDTAVRHRFQLCPNEDLKAAQDFDLSNEQWEQLSRGPNVEHWVAILHDLITRASDVAYISAQRTLSSSHGADRVRREESQYDGLWALNLPRPIPQLFLDRIKPITKKDAALIRGMGDGQIRLRYPCGHEDRLRRVQIAAMTDEAYLEKTCPSCGNKVIQKNDEVEAEMALTWHAGHLYKTFNNQWSGYDEWRDGTLFRRQFTTSTLLNALEKAKESLDMPESICPSIINPVSFGETAKIFQCFQQKLGSSHESKICTPLEAEQYLYRLATEALSGDINDEEIYPAGTVFGPPGYARFMMTWIARAVNFYLDLTDLAGTAADEEKFEQDLEAVRQGMDEMEMAD